MGYRPAVTQDPARKGLVRAAPGEPGGRPLSPEGPASRPDVDVVVIGSKLIAGAEDERPWARHAASLLYNGLLRATLGFRGTDTHGLKAFLRAPLTPVARACVVDKDVFASEFVIRAYREGLRIWEIPVRVKEKRRPSINLVRRVPNVLKSLAKLTWAIRVKG